MEIDLGEKGKSENLKKNPRVSLAEIDRNKHRCGNSKFAKHIEHSITQHCVAFTDKFN